MEINFPPFYRKKRRKQLVNCCIMYDHISGRVLHVSLTFICHLNVLNTLTNIRRESISLFMSFFLYFSVGVCVCVFALTKMGSKWGGKRAESFFLSFLHSLVAFFDIAEEKERLFRPCFWRARFQLWTGDDVPRGRRRRRKATPRTLFILYTEKELSKSGGGGVGLRATSIHVHVYTPPKVPLRYEVRERAKWVDGDDIGTRIT